MTDALDAVIALLVAGLLNLMVVSTLRSRVPAPEAAFLVRVYLATLGLRYALAVFLNLNAADSGFALTFWGDSGTYDHGGHLLALSWSGETLINPHLSRYISGYGFFYFVGAIYAVFGRNQLLVQFINGTIGALTVVVIFAITRRLFDTAAARRAALFMAFFPQMVFWSAAMYKDPAIMLCIACAMYAVVRLREEFTPRFVVLFVGSALVLMTLRFYVFYLVVFAALGTFGLVQRRGAARGLAQQLVLVGAFVAAYSFSVKKETFERHLQQFDLRHAQTVRLDQATLGRSAYAQEGDVSTPQGALAALPRGLLYLLLAPFPWSVRGLRQMLTVPEMLAWYALLPAFIAGLAYTLRRRLRPALPILLFSLLLTIGYALAQGNVGTAYRQRTQITMFFFVFMGVGLAERARRRRPPELAAVVPSAQSRHLRGRSR